MESNHLRTGLQPVALPVELSVLMIIFKVTKVAFHINFSFLLFRIYDRVPPVINAEGKARTYDAPVNSRMLYQLS